MMVFWPPEGIQFLNFDDIEYITDNFFVRTGLTLANIKWAFTATVQEHWHPLTWLSHMLDCQLFGLNPAYHHLVNVALHTMNTLLLFFIFMRMTSAMWRSAAVALLFAVHPLHVESVMWMAERKDVLSTFFGFLAILAYVGYVKLGNYKRYLLALLFYALALLSKSMLVTLPCLLLLLDYWPLNRYRQNSENMPNHLSFVRRLNLARNKRNILDLLIEKIPFLILSIAVSAVLMIIHHDRILHRSFDDVTFTNRISKALFSYLEYIGKMLWPQNLATPYPSTHEITHGGEILWAGIFLLSVSLMAIIQIKRSPYLLVGWMWFIGTLVPVIGLVATGPQNMADRYTYVPLVGLFIMIIWEGHTLAVRLGHQKIIFTATVIPLVVVLCAVTRQQVNHWTNSITLLTHALKVTRNNEKAHVNLGTAFATQGDHKSAILHFTEALRINPESEENQTNMALSLRSIGRYEEAADHFSKAIRISPKNAKLYVDLGITCAMQKKIKEAIIIFKQSLLIDPNYSKAHYNLGIAYGLLNNNNQAVYHLQTALKLDPQYDMARIKLQSMQKR
jgi:tetratricopeptide (TPR) repeat protein